MPTECMPGDRWPARTCMAVHLSGAQHGSMKRDLLITAASFVLVHTLVTTLGMAWPGQAAVLAALAVATWRLRLARSGWVDLGLRRGMSLPRVLAWAVAAYLCAMLANIAIVIPLGRLLDWPPLAVGALGELEGQPLRLAALLVIAWTTAAFGEEMLFRGFLMTRLERLLGAHRAAIAGAVVLQGLIFGVGHFYLGVRGAATAAVVGIVYGAFYYRCGRNLWPIIVAHGLTDTISLLVLYRGIAVPT